MTTKAPKNHNNRGQKNHNEKHYPSAVRKIASEAA